MWLVFQMVVFGMAVFIGVAIVAVELLN